MFHSLPAALIVGELAFLLASGDDVAIRLYKAGAVVLGYVSHLLLDELYSVEWYRGRLRLKRSFGTALKMYSPKKVWSNLSVYLKLGVLTYLILCEPAWMKDFRTQRADQQSPENVQQQTEQTVEEPNPESLQEQIERVAGEL